MKSKLLHSLREALEAAGLQDGMTVSFHHHLRNGDYILNLVLEEAARMGIRNLTVNASSPVRYSHASGGTYPQRRRHPAADRLCLRRHRPAYFLRDSFRAGGISLSRNAGSGHRRRPYSHRCRFCSGSGGRLPGKRHGKAGRRRLRQSGLCHTGRHVCQKKLSSSPIPFSPYPLPDWAISENWVDYVVQVDAIGDPKGILSGTTRITRDPVGLVMADTAAQVIAASGLLQDGFSFQTGAGGASLAAAASLKEIMLRDNIQGSFALGGITGYLVEMLRAGASASSWMYNASTWMPLPPSGTIPDTEKSPPGTTRPPEPAAPWWTAWTWLFWARQKLIRTLMSMSTPIPTAASWAARADIPTPPPAPGSP